MYIVLSVSMRNSDRNENKRINISKNAGGCELQRFTLADWYLRITMFTNYLITFTDWNVKFTEWDVKFTDEYVNFAD